MRILFYIVILPLSKLPFALIYGISNGLSFALNRVLKYRKEIVMQNLKNSFPDRSEAEIKTLANQFYDHFADILVEGIKMFSLSKKQVMQRYACKNPEVLFPYFEQKKSLILVSAHYNNWEYMVLSMGMQFKHHGVGVGRQQKNKVFDRIINRYRQRYGTEVVFASNVRETFETYENQQLPTAYMMLFDQAKSPKKSYWTTFLNQDTGFIFGPEYFAKKYDFPVFYYNVKKVKRGFYEFDLTPIAENPNQTEYGEITQKCINILEQTINEKPQYWLWSHRRWKHRRIEN
ncbi:MAG: lysophospholipid acyltransferase family protein [Bacteroidales bacterium]|nr:lysophospholipid acyltransferase family protein [Bacteroidales bacterium]